MWKDFWALSRTEQRGFIIVASFLVLLLIILLIPHSSTDGNMALLTSLENSAKGQTSIAEPERYGAVEAFNPNLVSIAELEKMGLNRSCIINWKKYLEAGGHFRNVEDVRKLYGIDTLFFEKASKVMLFNDLPVMNHRKSFAEKRYEKTIVVDLNMISRMQMEKYGFDPSVCDSILTIRKDFWFTRSYDLTQLSIDPTSSVLHYFQSDLSRRTQKSKVDDFVLELNSADTSQLVLLKGIGPVLARRIVQYRRLTGGFYQLDQLLQVYGISPVVLDAIKSKLTIDPSHIVPLNINHASLRRLKDHPLLGYYRAQAIVDYRNKSGNVRQLDDIFALEPFSGVDTKMFGYYFCLN